MYIVAMSVHIKFGQIIRADADADVLHDFTSLCS